MDDINLPDLQTALNQLIYTDIHRYLTNLNAVVSTEQSFQLVLAALSTNLGLLLSQVSNKNREEYSQICKDIIDKSCNTYIELSDEIQYGQIGHA